MEGPCVHVLYASQTGCAREVAERIARQVRPRQVFSRRRGTPCPCAMRGNSPGMLDGLCWPACAPSAMLAAGCRLQATNRSFPARVLACDDFDVTQLPAVGVAVFVLSVTGQGDPPENMANFWRFLLRKGLPSDSLAEVGCAVFGLGDSSYPKYAGAIRRSPLVGSFRARYRSAREPVRSTRTQVQRGREADEPAARSARRHADRAARSG